MKALGDGLSIEQPDVALKPEERLLLAVIESAYWDLQSGDPTKLRTAQQYFLDNRQQHPFSFLAICEYFSWSPSSIRSKLHAFLPTEGIPLQGH